LLIVRTGIGAPTVLLFEPEPAQAELLDSLAAEVPVRR
jgi:hypothetical protein